MSLQIGRNYPWIATIVVEADGSSRDDLPAMRRISRERRCDGMRGELRGSADRRGRAKAACFLFGEWGMAGLPWAIPVSIPMTCTPLGENPGSFAHQ